MVRFGLELGLIVRLGLELGLEYSEITSIEMYTLYPLLNVRVGVRG